MSCISPMFGDKRIVLRKRNIKLHHLLKLLSPKYGVVLFELNPLAVRFWNNQYMSL